MELLDNRYEDRISIRPDCLCLYSQYVGDVRHKRVQAVTGSDVRKRQSVMSNAAIKRLKNAINILTYTATYKTVWVKASNSYFRYKINFITLTLPSKQQHSDKDINKLLSMFLENWSKRRKGLLYVWKAEVQDNGNIHYHITSNAFYNYKRLREDWNRIVDKLGYVQRCRVDNPNSTDVHSVSSIRNIAAYLISYCCKKDLYTKILKRYFKRYGPILRSLKNNVFVLPNNYYKHIKRKVNGSKWGASKCLLGISISVSRWNLECKSDILMLEDSVVKYSMLQLKYCSILPLKVNKRDGYRLQDFKGLESVYKEELRVILNKQNTVQQTDFI